MQIEITSTAVRGAPQRVTAQSVAGRPAIIKSVPGARIEVTMDGVKQTGKELVEGRKVNVKKVGDNLVIETEAGSLVEIVDFYVTEGAVLDGAGWAAAESMGLAATEAGLMASPVAAGTEAAAASVGPSVGASMSPAVIGALALGGVAAAAGGGGSRAAAPAPPAVIAADTTPPAAPTLNTVTANSVTPVLTGTAGAGSTVDVTVGGATFTIIADSLGAWTVDTGTATPSSGGPFSLGANGTKNVTLVSTDAASNATSGAGSITLDTLSASLVASTPSDNAVAVPVGDDIVLTFSEAIRAGTGNIVISDGGTDIRTISIGDATQVTFSGSTMTINPAAALVAGKTYSITFASGVVEDLVGNAYAGITSATALNFDTEAPASARLYLSSIASGVGGFVINGQAMSDTSGFTIANAGDVNGDGFDDIVVGSNGSPASGVNAGRSYVVFGKTNTVAVDLSDVANGIGGFVINGQSAGDRAGYVAAAGDMNNDGLADLIVGAPFVDVGGTTDAGAAYVVYGKTTSSAVELSDVAVASGGFLMTGFGASSYTGYSVSSAGDVNGDGYADLIVGGFGTGTPSASGSSYVVLGKSSMSSLNFATLQLFAGGYWISGESAGDSAGISVTAVGDVNGDGLDDVLVGAYHADPSGRGDAGISYVVFGKSNGATVLLSEIAQGAGGFVVNGESPGDESGYAVSGAGDVNGDGVADMIIGAHNASPGSRAQAGRSYVVFGTASTAAIELSNVSAGLSHGFVINGDSALENSGWSVGAAGDVNGDGLADVIVGAILGENVGNVTSGRSYVVFGKTDLGAVNASDLVNGIGGFVIDGESNADYAGYAVSAAGDVNGDGLADLLVSAHNSDPFGNAEAGRSYVIFGTTSGANMQSAVDWMGTDNDDVFGATAQGQTAVGGAGNDALVTGYASVLYGGAGNDVFAIGTDMVTAMTSPYGSGGNNGFLARIDGGSGIDELSLASSVSQLNLNGARLASIEKISLNSPLTGTLTLTASDVLRIAGIDAFDATGRHQLMVRATIVDLADGAGTAGWVHDATPFLMGGTAYDVWNHAANRATLYVDPTTSVI